MNSAFCGSRPSRDTPHIGVQWQCPECTAAALPGPPMLSAVQMKGVIKQPRLYRPNTSNAAQKELRMKDCRSSWHLTSAAPEAEVKPPCLLSGIHEDLYYLWNSSHLPHSRDCMR